MSRWLCPLLALAGAALIGGCASTSTSTSSSAPDAPAAAKAPDGPLDDEALARVVDARLEGDVSGACFAVAVISEEGTARAYRCADPKEAARVGPDVAFEIGSVAKTMTALLLADAIVRGEMSLDDPLERHLPEGVTVPSNEGQPILLKHIVTHTSGLPALPARMSLEETSDPYAALDEETLLGSLDDVTLSEPPGTRFEYSNFGFLLLSLALSKHAGVDFETLLRDRVLAPLEMTSTFITEPPAGVREAAGHLPNGEVTPPWRFPVDMAGVGGVRATLDDMVRYAEAQLRAGRQAQAEAAGSLGAAIRLTQAPLETAATQRMGMAWLLFDVGGRTVHGHEGGTGGFSSLMGFDLERGRAVVVLSDTALTQHGGLSDIGLHLLDPSLPLGKPRTAPSKDRSDAPPPSLSPEELRAYGGTYNLMPGFDLVVRERDGRLYAQATGQGEFPLDAAAVDVFEAATFGVELRFERGDDGAVKGLELHQAGHVLRGERR